MQCLLKLALTDRQKLWKHARTGPDSRERSCVGEEIYILIDSAENRKAFLASWRGEPPALVPQALGGYSSVPVLGQTGRSFARQKEALLLLNHERERERTTNINQAPHPITPTPQWYIPLRRRYDPIPPSRKQCLTFITTLAVDAGEHLAQHHPQGGW